MKEFSNVFSYTRQSVVDEQIKWFRNFKSKNLIWAIFFEKKYFVGRYVSCFSCKTFLGETQLGHSLQTEIKVE